jgi:hypothetical protein
MRCIIIPFPRILPIILLISGMQLAGQEADGDTKKRSPWEHDHRHIIGADFGITFVPLGNQLEETDARGLWAPNVGLDYFYRITRRWGAGFLGAIELDHYVVTDDQVERENALNLTLVGMYSPARYLDLFLGGGIEIEKHDNLAVLRLGTQYSMHVGSHWAVVPKLYFDFKENYNTWTFVVSLARKF